MRRYLVVGTGIAGLSACEAIRERDPAGDVTLVGEEPHPFYSRPGLAYLLTGSVPEPQLYLRTPAEVAALGVRRLHARAAALDPAGHRLVLEDGRELPYDRLLLATGAVSIPPVFPGAELEGVMQLDGLDQARRLLRLGRKRRSAVVVGGGSTALEIVEGLHARGVRVHYFLRGDRYWSKVLDPVESAIVEERLEAEGVRLHRRTEVRRAQGKNGRLTGVETAAGAVVPCDVLAVAVGVRPRLELAQAAGVETDRGILVDDRLESRTPGVFAAGDVAQVRDPVTGRAELDTLWSSALAQGRAAGLNLAGADAAYRKDVPMNVTRLAGLVTTVIGAVGGGKDPDMVTMTRGQSEAWTVHGRETVVQDRHGTDRVRVMLDETRVVGALVMGAQTLSHPLARLVAERADISSIRGACEAHPEEALRRLLAFHDERYGGRAAAH
ncbi:MAG TPA: FAD-dependent oxidoreductase [Longimicrobiaceae bacterium]|nr:FAD-dependent oxidoreductase [Longimicrobiaceae bacterium]